MSVADCSAEVLLALQKVSVNSATSPIIENIDLALHRGEIVTVIGPNGAGKSTLIKTALGIITADSGTIEINPVSKIGYVPQLISLDPTFPITVKRFLQLTDGFNPARQTELMAMVNIENILDQSMHHISGGELRRVLLCKALIRTPDILILDEPTAGVDIGGQGALYQLIQTIRDTYQCGILLVSHDLHIVMAATDRVYCLNRHLCCSGKPEQVREHPEYIAIFGKQGAESLGVYRHHHDHQHDLHGDICNHG